MRRGMLYTVGTALSALVVAGMAVPVVDPSSRPGVWVGVAVGAAFQTALFWLLFVWVFPGQRLLAHGIGMVGRMFLLGFMALAWVPLLGTPLAPTLFSLVGVFFLTTLFEPAFLKPISWKRA